MGGNTNLTAVPQLKALYKGATKKLDRLDAYLGECERRLSACLVNNEVPPIELQDSIACAKIVASETSIDLCFRLKQDVGSYALMGETGFEQMDFLQACKFAEGDSRILMQKLARDRVKRNDAVGSAHEQELAKKLQEVLKNGPQGWDENFEIV